MKKRELTPRQQAFVNEYVISRDGTAAAQRAGYANPAVAASRMLTKDNIRAAIDRRGAGAFLESVGTGLHGVNCECCPDSENYNAAVASRVNPKGLFSWQR
jgi:hypothetical protein